MATVAFEKVIHEKILDQVKNLEKLFSIESVDSDKILS